MSTRRQHSLLIEVRGSHGDKRTVTRRALDGAFECTCPWFINRKTECRHIVDVKAAVSGLMPEPDLARLVENVVRSHPLFIGDEEGLVRKLRDAVSR